MNRGEESGPQQSGQTTESTNVQEQDSVDTADAEEESAPVSPRILVVDDEEVVCRFLEQVLLPQGHQVHACLSGQEALTRLENSPFEVVITDLIMPGVDGLQVLRRARELDPLCQIIVITAFGSVESAVQVMKLGAYDYIVKPFNIDEIRILVDKALEKRALLLAAEERDVYRDLSLIDGLTELYNYRAFYELLQAETTRAKRHNRPVSLLMTDLDGLKAYNDALGHPAGDALLKAVAWSLKKAVRNCDFVARYGGDEFAIILVETSKIAAADTADRVRRFVEEMRFENDDVLPHQTVTISIGVATFPTDAEDKAQLVAKADQALYEAKTAGGNVVRVAQAERK